MVKEPVDGGAAYLVEGCFPISVATCVQAVRCDPNYSRAPLRCQIVGPHKQAEVALRFRWDHPAAQCLRIFAVHFSSSDFEGKLGTILELKFSLDVDLK